MIDTTNLNGKTWLDEGGIVSYAEHVLSASLPRIRIPSPTR